jgi:hypothetical protein
LFDRLTSCDLLPGSVARCEFQLLHEEESLEIGEDRKIVLRRGGCNE